MKFGLIVLILFLVGCSYTNLNGIPASIDLGSTPVGRKLVKDGRDDKSSQMGKMPSPPSEPVESPKPIDIQVQNPNEPIPIDDGLDFEKMK